MSLKNTDIAVKNWEEKDYQLVEVQEWFEYKGNDREHAGWKYVIVLPRLRYEKVAVKVPNPNGEVPFISSEKLAELGSATVTFTNLNVGMYTRTAKNSEFVSLELSAKADGISLAKEPAK
ncbi:MULTISPECIES: hypothetical protein [Streptococcus]|uniref:hypothetical protein n=1 Tax=Streptococcus TaxID=1301 RepID=UPI00097874A4|nr:MULTISPECIES: hypothetical protein [Streptococcus]MCK1241204.1 hypothetical protein [Streptococcus uberis]HEN6098038.1 hypothetical protein [Streptococcus agalactiae]